LDYSLIGDVELGSGESGFTWKDGEKGHMQNIVEYLATIGRGFTKECSKCPITKSDFQCGNDGAQTRETILFDSPVLVFTVDTIVNNQSSCAETNLFYFPAELVVGDLVYRLTSRIYSTKDWGQHFITQSYFSLPTPGYYEHDCMENDGIAIRRETEGNFHGRTARGWCVFYTVMAKKDE
jgi:hypothetical protein